MTKEPVVPRGYDELERYFHEKDAELLKALGRRRAELNEARDKREAEQRKGKHWMKCPKCGHDLEEVELDLVKVDRCRNCEGVYFDKGEVELLLEAHSFAHKLQRLLFTKPEVAR